MRFPQSTPGILVVCLFFCFEATAQVPPEPFMKINVSDECATEGQRDLLLDEIRLRLPDLLIVEGPIEAPSRWKVRWERVDGSCELTFESVANASTMRLHRMADSQEIQLAASRVAWLTSVSRDEETPTLPGAAGAAPDENPPSAPPPPENEEPEKAQEEPQQPDEATDRAGPDEESVKEPEEQPSTAAQARAGPTIRTVPFRLSLIPGVEFPANRNRYGDREEHVARFSLNLIGGRTHAVNGVEFGQFSNREDAYMHGAQFSGGVNLVGTEMRGFQMAGIGNINQGLTSGVSLSGMFNVSSGGMEGLQLSPMVNSSHGGRTTGAQAGSANLAADVAGLQLGFFNLAENVDGLQLGLINISETADAPIGLVNVMYGEPLYLTSSGGTSGLALVGLKHGNRHLRWSYLLGLQPFVAEPVFAGGLGLGTHIPFDPLFIDVDLLLLSLSTESAPLVWKGFLTQLRGVFGWQMFSRFAIYAGPALNFLVREENDSLGVAPDYGFFFDSGGTQPFGWAWPEFVFGIRI